MIDKEKLIEICNKHGAQVIDETATKTDVAVRDKRAKMNMYDDYAGEHKLTIFAMDLASNATMKF